MSWLCPEVDVLREVVMQQRRELEQMKLRLEIAEGHVEALRVEVMKPKGIHTVQQYRDSDWPQRKRELEREFAEENNNAK